MELKVAQGREFQTDPLACCWQLCWRVLERKLLISWRMETSRALSVAHRCPGSECRNNAKKSGFFRRLSDKARIQRYSCTRCGRSFSDATDSVCYGQKKRHLNATLLCLLASAHSERRCALNLRINLKTVVRKSRFLASMCSKEFARLSALYPPVRELQFDDMESFEHSKCKPLSITLAVEHKKRRILGFQVSQMPAKGLLAEFSRKKYGPRADRRPQARDRLFSQLKPFLAPDCVIRSDQNPHYVDDIKRHFPGHPHRAFKGRRGCVVGQGELKRGGFDPLFTLNHTCAMLRDNIKRLARKTWCTTKKPERLSDHIAIYAIYHNEFLIRRSQDHEPGTDPKPYVEALITA